jgi:hypothetical protein
VNAVGSSTTLAGGGSLGAGWATGLVGGIHAGDAGLAAAGATSVRTGSPSSADKPRPNPLGRSIIQRSRLLLAPPAIEGFG